MVSSMILINYFIALKTDKCSQSGQMLSKDARFIYFYILLTNMVTLHCINKYFR